MEHLMPDRILLFVKDGHGIGERPLNNAQLYASHVGTMEGSPEAISFHIAVIIVSNIGKHIGFQIAVRCRNLDIADSGIHKRISAWCGDVRGDPHAIGACRQEDVMVVIILHPAAGIVLVVVLDIVQGVLGGVHRMVGLGVDEHLVAVVVGQGKDEVCVVVTIPGNRLHGDMIREGLREPANQPQQTEYHSRKPLHTTTCNV